MKFQIFPDICIYIHNHSYWNMLGSKTGKINLKRYQFLSYQFIDLAQL